MSDLPDRLSLANRSPLSESAPADPTALRPVPHALLLWLTVGVAGAVLFTATYLIEGATRPGYNGWQQAISALSLGPGSWIQQANFVVFGVCTLCLAVAWRKILKGGVGALSYPIIRGIEGLVFILVGFFSQDPAPGYPPGTTLTPPTLHGEIHLIGAFVIVGAMVLGFFVIAWRFAKDLHWWGWAVYSVISGSSPSCSWPSLGWRSTADMPDSSSVWRPIPKPSGESCSLLGCGLGQNLCGPTRRSYARFSSS